MVRDLNLVVSDLNRAFKCNLRSSGSSRVSAGALRLFPRFSSLLLGLDVSMTSVLAAFWRGSRATGRHVKLGSILMPRAYLSKSNFTK